MVPGNYTIKMMGSKVKFFVDSYHPGAPAKLSGLPEDCYPDESAEVDWRADTGNEYFNSLIDDDEYRYDEIETKLIEAIESESAAAYLESKADEILCNRRYG